MYSLPLHPIVVHLPLVIAMLLPVVIASVLVGRRIGPLNRRSWWSVVVVGALLAGGTVAALKTGELDEELVESVVGDSALEQHEEAGEAIMWGSLLLLALLVPIPFIRSLKLERAMGVLALVGGLTLSVLAIRAGHSGGELVYRYGAAAAHLDNAVTGSRHEDSDDH